LLLTPNCFNPMPLQQRTKRSLFGRSCIILVLFLFSFQSTGITQNKKTTREIVESRKYSVDYVGDPPDEVLTDDVVPDPQVPLDSLDRYRIAPKEHPLGVALKADDMISSLQHPLREMDVNPAVDVAKTKEIMTASDRYVLRADGTYAQIHDMYSQIDTMKQKLNSNYDAFNKSDKSEQAVARLNKESDAMANYVHSMRANFVGMKQQIQTHKAVIEGMVQSLDEMAIGGKKALPYYDQLSKHLNDVSNRFEQMGKNLKAEGLEAPGVMEETRQYLSSFQKYVQAHKPYTQNLIKYTADIKNYINRTKDYLQKVEDSLGQTGSDLEKNEEFFRSAKVGLSEDRGIEPPAMETPDACAGVFAGDDYQKKKPLMTQEKCQSECRTVCRQKAKNASGAGCFECPSGSPDTCAAVGALDASHDWCKPGGICHSDPNLQCVPFGTVGPQGEKLQCTNCKPRPDECWQKVDPETTNLTHCKQRCWDGVCVYAGKYKNEEWDGTPEFMHCYKCKTPPGPPTCEDLGWGTTWIGQCRKDCPDGECRVLTITIGPDGKPKVSDPNAPPPPAPPAAPGGGDNAQPGAPGQDGQGGQDGTQAGGGAPAGGDGKKPTPPTGGPSGPSTGGGGTVAGGPQEPGKAPQAGPTGPQGGGDQKPPDAPPTTQPKEPQAPDTGNKPKPPEPPKVEVTNPNIEFYKKWLKETEDRIKSRQEILNNTTDGETVKDMARQDLEGMTKTKADLEKKIKEEEDREREKLRIQEEQRKRAEEYERSRPKPVDYAAEAERRGQIWKLNKLQEATTALRNKAQEAKDALEARKKRIEEIEREIRNLQNENQYFTDSGKNGQLDSDFTKTRIKQNEERIRQLQANRNEFIKKLNEAQKKYEEEISKLQSEYRAALWRVDENARRKAEAERIDEYLEREQELRHREQTRAERNKTFTEIETNIENAIKDAEARGDSSEASKLKQQLENLKREHASWNSTMERQEEAIKSQLHELGWRNFSEGAGPSSTENLGEKLNQYAKYFEDKLKDPNLNPDQRRAIEAALEGAREKAAAYKNPQLSPEELQRIHDTTTRVANGAMNMDPDKSFLRLAAESVVEEGVHNLNPFVAAKKSLAFGVGIVQGVGHAVVGVGKAIYAADKYVVQTMAVNMGFEDGGIFGTDAIDSLNSVITTVVDNANFDGVLKAVVAAGGAIDKKITELERSGDIDWATSNFGGRVAGEYVVAPELGALGIGKAAEFLSTGTKAAEVAATTAKVDQALDAANAAAKAETAITEGASAGSKLEGAATHIDDIKAPVGEPLPASQARGPPAEAPVAPKPAEPMAPKPAEPAGPATPATKANEPPPGPSTPATHVEPPAPAAPATGIGENRALSFKTADGQTINLQTGEQLGKGSTSTVFVDATNPNKAIRITSEGASSPIPGATKLDEAGRAAIESIQRPGGPVRIVEKGERFTVNDPSSPLHGKTVEVVERVQNGSADKFLPKQSAGGQMTRGQAEAFDMATREMNKNGYAWLDNHTGNYGFEKIPGKEDAWQVVVLDPGGIVPMKGATLAERAESAAALQRRLNVPTEDFAATMDFVKNKPANIQRMVWAEERGNIINEFGSKIDTQKLGLLGPEDVAFYPAGTYQFPEVQALSKMSQAEAAAYYAGRTQ
jgi:hypothetical protein